MPVGSNIAHSSADVSRVAPRYITRLAPCKLFNSNICCSRKYLCVNCILFPTDNWIKLVYGQLSPKSGHTVQWKSYLLALGFSEQLTAATSTMFALSTLAADWHATLVEPVLVNSHIFGLRDFLPSKLANTTKKQTVTLSEIYDMTKINKILKTNVSPHLSMVSSECFLANAPRDITLLHFIDKRHIGLREFAFHLSETISVEKIFQTTNTSVVDCSFGEDASALQQRLEHHLNAMKTSLKVQSGNFTVKRFLCLDFWFAFRSHVLLQNLSLPGTVIFTNWHGCGLKNCSIFHNRNYQLLRKPRNSSMFRPIILTQKGFQFNHMAYSLHHPNILKVARDYLSACGVKWPFIGVHVRLERLMMNEVALQNNSYIKYCLQNLKKILDHLKKQFGLYRRLLFTDMGKYGTDSCSNSRCYKRDQLFSMLEGLGLTVSSYNPKVLNGTENSGYVSLVEMNMMALGEKLVLVGGGGFEITLQGRFLSLHHRVEDVYHVCCNRTSKI